MEYLENEKIIQVSLEEFCLYLFNDGDMELPFSFDMPKDYPNADAARSLEKISVSYEYLLNDMHFKIVSDAYFDHSVLSLNQCLTVNNSKIISAYLSKFRLYITLLGFLYCEKLQKEYVQTNLFIFNKDKLAETVSLFVEHRDVKRVFVENARKYFSEAARFADRYLLQYPSLKDFSFPYPSFRKGQRELIENVYMTIATRKRLIVQAPTGIGKTISVLYPAVKSIGDRHTDKIFYLTAKASTRKEALDACKRIDDHLGNIRAIVLYAREQMCSNDLYASDFNSEKCNSQHCFFAKGYYQKLQTAREEILNGSPIIDKDVILATARRHGLCPYELSLDISEYCDVVICDYNYLFDPRVSLKRYFDGNISKRYVFLIDEAHNLSDRARDTFTAELRMDEFIKFHNMLPDDQWDFKEKTKDIIRKFWLLRDCCGETLQQNADGTISGYNMSVKPYAVFNEFIQQYLEYCQKLYKKISQRVEQPEWLPKLKAFIKLISDYILLLDYYDEHFRSYYEIVGNHVRIKILCLDASDLIDRCMKKAVSSILFSATLSPMPYFKDITGVGKDAKSLELPSPFNPDNLGVFVCSNVTSRLSKREENYPVVADYIAASISGKKGNYFVFFPSFAFMKKVHGFFRVKYPSVTVFTQKPNMTHEEKEQFLDKFKRPNGKYQVGFCVLSGSFSEGINLPGDQLIGSIIVGIGLPEITNEGNILSEYYEEKTEMGYSFAYLFPGASHVFQAGGRVIRSEVDQGIIVLLDDRYLSEDYKNLFPSHWNQPKIATNPSNLAKKVSIFWENPD